MSEKIGCVQHDCAHCKERGEAIKKLIEAWDALPGNQYHRPKAIEKWLIGHMGPAITRMREVL